MLPSCIYSCMPTRFPSSPSSFSSCCSSSSLLSFGDGLCRYFDGEAEKLATGQHPKNVAMVLAVIRSQVLKVRRHTSTQLHYKCVVQS